MFFRWHDEYQESFDRLKDMMSESMTLAYTDSNKEYKIYTDASIRACLTQKIYDEGMKSKMERKTIFSIS